MKLKKQWCDDEDERRRRLDQEWTNRGNTDHGDYGGCWNNNSDQII